MRNFTECFLLVQLFQVEDISGVFHCKIAKVA